METEEKKINFWNRIKIAVAKLEDYTAFLEEKTSVAVKYFFLIVLIFSVVVTAVETYSFMKIVNKGYNYIKNELPEFSYEDGNLEFSTDVNAYDGEYDFYMIADTNDVSEEKLNEYKQNIKSIGILLLKDKVIYKDGSNEIEYTYNDITSEYGIETLDKDSLVEKIDSIGMAGITSTVFIILLFSLYIVNIISIFMDWLIIAVFAYCATKICRINMSFKQVFNISIYSLTLSIILSIFYNVAYYLTGFYIEYFRIVYLLISYVYVVAVIMMMKSDLLKQQVEVGKIIEVQKEIHEELENPDEDKDEEKEKTKDEKDKESKEEKNEQSDENNIAGEPDGSEI